MGLNADGIYVCDDCGTAEAMLDFMRNPLPLECWAVFREDAGTADFKAVPGEEALKTITAAGVYGSTISSYRTSLDGVTYTAASFTASKRLSAAGSMTMTVTVTDSRGRTATYSTTFTVLDYTVPSITAFSAERCSSDGSAAQLDGWGTSWAASTV